MITPGATSIAHEPLDPADDARGEQHFVPDLDLLADLQLAPSALAPRPDQEHVADCEQQNDEDQRERAQLELETRRPDQGLCERLPVQLEPPVRCHVQLLDQLP